MEKKNCAGCVHYGICYLSVMSACVNTDIMASFCRFHNTPERFCEHVKEGRVRDATDIVQNRYKLKADEIQEAREEDKRERG